MKNKNLVLLFLLLMVEGWLLSAAAQSKSSVYKPWSHGQLKVSKENRYLMNADGTPFLSIFLKLKPSIMEYWP